MQTEKKEIPVQKLEGRKTRKDGCSGQGAGIEPKSFLEMAGKSADQEEM